MKRLLIVLVGCTVVLSLAGDRFGPSVLARSVERTAAKSSKAAAARTSVSFHDDFTSIDASRWHVSNDPGVNAPTRDSAGFNCPGNAVGGCPASNVSLTPPGNAAGPANLYLSVPAPVVASCTPTSTPTCGPGARFYAAAAYDNTAHTAVLFGGCDANDCPTAPCSGACPLPLGDTWTWDGTPPGQSSQPLWSQWNSSPSPPARTGASMAYDAATGTVVLFGGCTLNQACSSVLNDTWVWNGLTHTWTAQSPSGAVPDPREFAGMAYDAVRQQIVLFGGINAVGTYLADTWTWDGAGWTARCGTSSTPSCGPAGRYTPNMTFDAATGTTVLFGGFGPDVQCPGGDFFFDTWSWNGSSWSQLTPAHFPDASQLGLPRCTPNASAPHGAAGRGAAGFAYSAALGKAILFGGSNGNPLNDEWLWDGADWSPVCPTTVLLSCGPQPRIGPAQVYDAQHQQVELFGGLASGGGAGSSTYGDTWILPPPYTSGGQLVSAASFQSGTFTARLSAGTSNQALNAFFLFNFTTQDEIDLELTYDGAAHDAIGTGSGPTCGAQSPSNVWEIWVTVWNAGLCREHYEYPFSQFGLNPQAFNSYTIDTQPTGINVFAGATQLGATMAALPSAEMRTVLNHWLPCWKDPVRWPNRASGVCADPNAATGLDHAASVMTVDSVDVNAIQPAAVQSKSAGAGATVTVTTAPQTPGQAGVTGTLTNTGPSGSVATITAATYSGNPTGTAVIDVGGGYVDLRITNPAVAAPVPATFYYPSTVTGQAETSLQLQYFNANANAWRPVLSSGGATPAKDTTDNLDGTVSGGRFSVTFDATSTPPLSQLTGTPFTMAPPGSQLAVSVTGSGSGTVTSNPAGINCPGACSATFAAGTPIALTAHPTNGSSVASWTGGGCAGAGACGLTLNSDQFVSLALLAKPGPAWAWGDFSYGELGTGAMANATSPSPVSMPVGTSFTAVSGDGRFSLALDANGKAWAWGDNTFGQLGNGTTMPSSVPVAVSMPGEATFTSVVAGGYLSLALDTTGTAWAWGANDFGQLGNGTVSSSGCRCSSTPVQVSTVNLPSGVSFTAVAGGGHHNLALDSTGKAWAWGGNTNGQLGIGNPPMSVFSAPVAVTMPGGVTFIAVGASASGSVALDATGKAWAWGVSDRGQLGNGTTTGNPIPVPVTMPVGVTFTAVATSAYHVVALDTTGKAWAWGSNGSGELGTGTIASTGCQCGSTPGAVTMPGGVSFTTVSAGYLSSLALDGAGKAWAWGDNTSGQLGNGNLANAGVPTAVIMPSGVTFTSIAAGMHFNLALAAQAVLTVSVTGSGSGTVTSSPAGINCPGTCSATFATGTPVTLTAHPTNGSSIGGWTGGGCSGAGACNLTLTSNQFVSLRFVARPGPAYAWGNNPNGQLGNGGTADSSTPLAVSMPGVSFTAVSGGNLYSLGLDSTGKAWGWGYNVNGQLGNGGTADSSTPLAVNMPGGVSFIAVSAGNLHSLALDTTGKAWAWGYNGYGQLGSGGTADSSTPVAVSMPPGVSFVAVAAGYFQSVALDSTGKVWAWGRNLQGEVGNGTLVARLTTPAAVALPGGVTFIAVAAAYNYSMALDSTGNVWAWGRNEFGQLGMGSMTTTGCICIPTPGQVSMPNGVTFTAVAAGYFTGVALDSTGKAWAWGYNANGQLGNSTTTTTGCQCSSAPVAVSMPGGVTFSAVTAGASNGVGLDTTGNAWAWGYNYDGELGSGTTTTTGCRCLSTPVAVRMPSGATFTTFASGYYHSLALSVPPWATVTSLVSSANPSTLGQEVVLTATVAAAGGSGAPTGTVTFNDGTTTLGSGPIIVDVAGQAGVSVTTLSAGTHSVTAVYTAVGGNFLGSISAVLSQLVSADAGGGGSAGFSLACSPTSVSVQQGMSGPASCRVTSNGGFTGTVSLSCSGQPTGVTCGPASGAPPANGIVDLPLTITVPRSTTPATKSFAVTGISGSLNKPATETLVVTAAIDFSLACATPSTTVQLSGTSSSSSCSAQSNGGFTGTVSLSCPSGTSTGAPPAGVSCSFASNLLTPPSGGSASTAVTFAGASTLAPGTYPFSVTGVSGTITRAINLNLSVTSPVVPVANCSYDSITVQQASVSAAVPCSVTSSAGYSGGAALSCSGLPAGVTCSFNEPTVSVSPSAPVLLTLSLTGVNGALAPGRYAFQVTATGGPQPQITPLQLVVTTCAPVNPAAGQADTNGDGIPDIWEKCGVLITPPGGGAPVLMDLPAMGASDLTKRHVFVQMDWMVDSNHSMQLSSDALKQVVSAYAAHNIVLHIDNGPNSLIDYTTGVTWGSLSRAAAVPHVNPLGSSQSGVCPSSSSWIYNWTAPAGDPNPLNYFESTNYKNRPSGVIASGRAPVFHYAIAAHNFGCATNNSSGLSRGSASTSPTGAITDFIVAMGSWPNLTIDALGNTVLVSTEGGTLGDQAGAFMHELGHNLGLNHGGQDGTNNKPNYLSVMNYSFQLGGLTRNGAKGIFDYAAAALASLNEASLSEQAGALGSAAAGYGTTYHCSRGWQTVADASTAIDWNCDNTFSSSSVSGDVNHDGSTGVLAGASDWDKLVFQSGNIGNAGVAMGNPPLSLPPTSPAAEPLTPVQNQQIQGPPVMLVGLSAAPNDATCGCYTATTVTVNLSAVRYADAASVVGLTYQLTGAQSSGGPVTLTTSTATISITAVGTTTLTFYGRDAAGNLEAVHTLVFLIQAGSYPAQQLVALRATVESYGLSGGTANSLDKKLQHAQREFAAGRIRRACSDLTDFLSEVARQSGEKLTVAQASQLTTLANKVRRTLRCGTGEPGDDGGESGSQHAGLLPEAAGSSQ